VVDEKGQYFINADFDLIPFDENKSPDSKRDATKEKDHSRFQFVNALYRDSNFVVTQFCGGEFGGTLYFFDLKKDKTYYTPATCAIAVNKIDEKYVLTISSAHAGVSEVIEVTDPTALTEVDLDTVEYAANFWYNAIWDGQSLERYDSLIDVMRGPNRQILDTFGLLIYTSFKYQKDIFHIYNSSNHFFDTKQPPCGLLIGNVKDNRMVAVDSLCATSVFTYYPQNRIYQDWTLYSFDHREENMGFIAIKNDTINLMQYRVRKNNKHLLID
jgi:hypothetical protein